MATTAKPTGPDLAAGVLITDVPDGGLLAGHAFGEAVLLVRRGEVFTAISGACTHYGGPLAEGLVVGDTVRCPWHHACFDLRSGEVLRAPALRSLQRYATAVANGTVTVTGKLDDSRPAESPVRKGKTADPVVIVGAGGAAAAAAEALRRAGFDGPITMLGREGTVPVDRPNLSKDYLAGTAPEEWIPLRDEGFYAGIGVNLRSGAEVASLDVAAKQVRLVDGSSVPYGSCLIATGSDPIRLPIPGAERALLLRTLADSRAIIAAAESAKRAVVIGASFIGLEVAASLRARGVEVCVVAPESVPLERALGPQVGAWVQSVHAGRGVTFRLGSTATGIQPDAVVLADGTVLPADLVVMGVGVRPNVGLAERAGIGVQNGILVDAHLRTDAPGVWAAGDVARWPDPHTGSRQRIEHWVLAQRQGEVAARNIAGRPEPFAAVPFFWSAHYDAMIHYVGFPGGDRVAVDGDLAGGSAAIAYRTGDRTLAVATVGRDDVSLEAERLLEADDHPGLARLVPG